MKIMASFSSAEENILPNQIMPAVCAGAHAPEPALYLALRGLRRDS